MLEGDYVYFEEDYVYQESLDLPSFKIPKGTIAQLIADGVKNAVIKYGGCDHIVDKELLRKVSATISVPKSSLQDLIDVIHEHGFDDPNNEGNRVIAICDLIPLLNIHWRDHGN